MSFKVFFLTSKSALKNIYNPILSILSRLWVIAWIKSNINVKHNNVLNWQIYILLVKHLSDKDFFAIIVIIIDCFL